MVGFLFLVVIFVKVKMEFGDRICGGYKLWCDWFVNLWLILVGLFSNVDYKLCELF